MTTTNHALAGSLIAVAVPGAGLAIPLAFLSHFAMDALPHFGIAIEGDDVRTRNNKPLFKWVVHIYVPLTVLAIIFLPIVFRSHVSWIVTLACIVAAIAPDFVWAYRFIKELKTGKLGRKSAFSKFHKWIQWGEYPWALAVDICWFIASLASVAVIVK